MLAPATLAALPSTRAIPDRDVFYVARPTRSILNNQHREARAEDRPPYLSTSPRWRLGLLPLVPGELEFRRCHVFLEMRERGCARDRAALFVFSYSALA